MRFLRVVMRPLLLWVSLLAIDKSGTAQTYSSNIFVAKDGYDYTVQVILTINRFRIPYIYYDAVTSNSGSFAYDPLFDYQVIIKGNKLPDPNSNFWDFTVQLSSSKQNNSITNNLNNTTKLTSASYVITSLNNNATYNGSATILGNSLLGKPLTTTSYTGTEANTLLNYLGYNSLILTLNAPGLGGQQSQTLTSTLSLPVTYGNIAAQYDGASNTVTVKWTTLSEINNDYFVVQKSADGKTFTDLTTVTSQNGGNSSSPTYYSATDTYPVAGTGYYRIKQVDKDGTVTYSKIVTSNNGTINTAQQWLRPYPNPLPQGQVLHISTNLPEPSDVHFRIAGLNGVTVASWDQAVPRGSYVLTVPSSARLPRGTYFVMLLGANGQSLTKSAPLVVH